MNPFISAATIPIETFPTVAATQGPMTTPLGNLYYGEIPFLTPSSTSEGIRSINQKNFTVESSGSYLITAFTALNINGTTTPVFGLLVNGQFINDFPYSVPNETIPATFQMGIVSLSAADTVSIAYFDGSPSNLVQLYSSQLSIVKVSE